MHARTHTYACTYIHSIGHLYIYYVCTYIHTDLCTCVCTYMHINMHIKVYGNENTHVCNIALKSHQCMYVHVHQCTINTALFWCADKLYNACMCIKFYYMPHVNVHTHHLRTFIIGGCQFSRSLGNIRIVTWWLSAVLRTRQCYYSYICTICNNDHIIYTYKALAMYIHTYVQCVKMFLEDCTQWLYIKQADYQ